MSVSVDGLRNAADFMRQQTCIDPKWLRDAADEIERLRTENAHALYRIGFVEGGLVEILMAAQADIPNHMLIDMIEKELRVVRAPLEIQDPAGEVSNSSGDRGSK